MALTPIPVPPTTPHRPPSGTPPLRSLANRLTRPLTLAVVSVWLVSTSLVAWYVDAQIQHNFDVELMESAYRQLYPALLDLQRGGAPAASERPQANIQEPQVMGEIPGSGHPEPLLLQLRDANGRVLLRTQATPASAFAVPLQAGFFDTHEYRIFSLYDAEHRVWLQLADPLDERSEASDRTRAGLVAVLLIMLPVLAWLIRAIARRELRSVGRLQQQIIARSGSNLQPLDLHDMPRELHAVGEGVNQLLDRLKEALDVERALAANAAHELRTPLAEVRLRLHTAIDLAAQQQVNGGNSDTPACMPVEVARGVLQSLETLSHRTERLLQLSRAEGGDVAHFGRVDLVHLATLVAEELWQQPRARKRLDLQVPDDASQVWVQGDIDGLAIVLRNLIDNALHHTVGAVELTVSITPHPALVVRDDGPGLSPAQLAQIQQRHARGGSQHLGYGLGMSIVRTIADKHGARLTLASPPPGHTRGLEVRLEFARTGGDNT